VVRRGIVYDGNVFRTGRILSYLMLNPQPANSNYSPYKAGSTIPGSSMPKLLQPTAPKKPKSWKKALGIIFVALVAGVGTFSYSYYKNVRSDVIVSGEGNSNGLLQYNADTTSIDWSKFKQPGDGRFNVLVLGIGGVADDGIAHDGTDLTDSIQVISLDTVNKKVSIVSVPRDFYYNIPGHGPSKINAVYEDDIAQNPENYGPATRAAIGKVLGVNISNFVVIDFTAAQQAVDDVGGIDVDVPTALYDPEYPCADQIHYCPFSISAGEHHMDGAVALEYMRTRHDDSDFARSARQQAVISALKAKALSLGTLSNPVTVSNLIQALATHVKTDLQPSEITEFLNIYKQVTPANTTNAQLDTNSSEGLLQSADLGGAVGDTEYPILGLSDYSAIHAWYAKQSPDPFIPKEAATISVVGSSRATAAQVAAYVQILQDYGFTANFDPSVLAPAANKTELFSKDAASKPVTANYLNSVTGATLQNGAPLDSGSDFEIVYVPS
jgi:LCP family protein required for cell wall assembly